ncbi:MAG: type II toxin-antitoxin system RelE/ParE family toxin [Actinobacteria bacterium]|nr:type II toxin-antitoxin system RelE/ParE family toxin [Actinomycetota bacterium]
MRVIWSPLAEEQVAESFAYVAAEHPAAAVRWFERLEEKTGSLAIFPDQGRMVPEVQRASVREVLVHPCRVIYRRGATEVVVLSVQHDHREFDVSGIEGEEV